MFPTVQGSMTNLSSALANSQVQSSQDQGGKAFLKFDFKSGTYTLGRDQEEVTGEQIAVNVASINHGWTLWVNGTPKKTQVSFTEPLPMAPPAEGTDEPSESRGFQAAFLEEDDDTIIVFETNSFGGRKGVDSMLDATKLKAVGGEEQYLFPIVKLDSESYKSKQGGTIHNPVFTVVDWMDMEGNLESGTKKIAQEEEAPAKPVRRRRG